MIVENRRLRLELEDNKIIDFVITGITPKDTNKNIEYSNFNTSMELAIN